MSLLRLKLLPIYLFLCLGILYLYSDYTNFYLEQLWSKQEKYTIYNNFCVLSNVIRSRNQEKDRIAQILHMSSNILDDRLKEQVENWNGPVSLAVVLIHKEDYNCIVEKLKSIVASSSLLKEYLRVHIVFPISWSPICQPPSLPSKCNIPKPTVDELAAYPANTARNAARMFSITKYILIADYEHLFSKHFEKDVLKIAQNTMEQKKRILIYRIFEIDHGVKEPETKADLKELMNKKRAVVFHSSFYNAHEIPGLPSWFAQNKTGGISTSDVRYTRHDWEPQFVSKSDIPMHDLNFPFLIRDNTCLRWEVCRAGYQFDILSDHFMYHKGIKRAADTSISSIVQRKNSWRFSQALSKFKKRMDEQYPDTAKNCPGFRAK